MRYVEIYELDFGDGRWDRFGSGFGNGSGFGAGFGIRLNMGVVRVVQLIQ